MNTPRFLLSLLAATMLSFTLNAQWSSGFIPYGRHGNAVVILDNYKAAIAGGNESNDSIRSIFMTTDRGTNWNINLDVIKPWLKSISFSNTTNGVAVGYSGTIVRTTDGGSNWSPVAAPGNTHNRQFNAVFFVNDSVGYIAGGWPANDSIQTILKTTDGGASWNIQLDNLGFWLRSIHFSDQNNGMAVGDHGMVLKTSDGGSNWTPITVPGNAGNRRYNSVYALNSTTAIIVGGNPSNDSIQTILKTTDGGTNWSILSDNLGPMLNGIDFAGASTAYIVGNRGVILKSTNNGDNWAPVNLSLSINDTLDLTAVNFYNADFGIAVGRYGKLLLYVNPLPSVPSVHTLPVSNLSSTTANLHATINANGSYAAVTFQYGTTMQLGTSIAASPDTVWGNTDQQVSVSLGSLIPNTRYYFRVKAENGGGEVTDTIMQFFTSDCEIPNCSFESWDSIFIDHPASWTYIGYPHKTGSYNSSNAVELSSGFGGSPSAVLFGVVDDGFPLEGGIPVTGQPDSLVCYAKYDVVAGDSAFAIVSFKLNDQPIYTEMFPISGSSGGNFVRLSFPFNFPNSTVPDSVVLGFVSSNPFNDSPSPNSMLTIDDVSFIGINSPIPNADFEQWLTDMIDYPTGWTTSELSDGPHYADQIFKTTDRVSGDFAIKLMGIASRKNTTIYAGPYTKNSSNQPTFPVSGRHNTLNFFMKYIPDNGDTLDMMLNLFKAGVNIGGAYLTIDTAISAYTAFALPINYYNQTDVPDSASLMVSIGRDAGHGNSVMYLDNMTFDGFGPVLGIHELPVAGGDFRLYPNPARDQVTANWNLTGNDPVQMTITDINGRELKRMRSYATAGQIKFSTADLPAGFYMVTLHAGSQRLTRKLIISE